MSRELILREIIMEREQQDELWGGPAHDDQNSGATWLAFATRHLGLMVEDGNLQGVCSESDPDRYRRQWIRVGAIAVAALEAHDRKTRQALAEERAQEPELVDSHYGPLTKTVLTESQSAEVIRTVTKPRGPVSLVKDAMEDLKKWTQAWANESGETVYLLKKKQDVLYRMNDCIPYLTLESQSESYQRSENNYLYKAEPNKE